VTALVGADKLKNVGGTYNGEKKSHCIAGVRDEKMYLVFNLPVGII
jgi:hypothetical protein